MTHNKRIHYAAALAVLFAFSVGHAVEPDLVAERKCAVVRAALKVCQATTCTDAVLLKAATRADALLDIELGTSADTTLVTLRSTGNPPCDAFTLDNGRRLVVDLYDTINLQAGRNLVPTTSTVIKQIRTSLFALEPQFVSRVVMDLSVPCTFEITQDADATTIDLAARLDHSAISRPLSQAIAKTDEELLRQRARIRIALAGLHESQYRERDAGVEEGPCATPDSHDALASLHHSIQQRYLTHSAALERRIAALDTSLQHISIALAEDDLSETEAWSALQMLGDRFDRIQCDDAMILEDLRAERAAADDTLALPLALANVQETNSIVQPRTTMLSARVSHLANQLHDLQAEVPADQPILDYARLDAASGLARAAVARGFLSSMAMLHAVTPVINQAADSVNTEIARAQHALSNPPDPEPEQVPAPRILVADAAETTATILTLTADDIRGGSRPFMMDQRIAELTTDLASVTTVEPAIPDTDALVFAALGDDALAQATPVPDPPKKRGAATPASSGMLSTMTGLVEGLSATAATPAPTPSAASSSPTEVIGESVLDDLDVMTVVLDEPAMEEELISVVDPLEQPVNIDFRDMELSHVVGLLAEKAQINVVAGTEVSGIVTARLSNVTLRQAMETALRLNNLGLIDDHGIYRIVPYEDVVKAATMTRIIYLENAQAPDVKKTCDEVLLGRPDGDLVTISANTSTNVLIISGPEEIVNEFEDMVRQLDVAEPTLPTLTVAIKLNYADPEEVEKILRSVVISEGSNVVADELSRHVIVTEVPVRIEQIRQLIKEIDIPVKQVSIDTMIIDAVLEDASQTGVDWIINAVQETNQLGEIVGNLQDLSLTADTTGSGVTPDTVSSLTQFGQLGFNILSADFDIRGILTAQVSNSNARLVANPVVVTIENKEAQITISREIPYQEFRQSTTGPPMTSTEFKEIGTVLTVTPTVTHDNHVIVDLDAKQSDTKGEFQGIPIEDKREATTSLRVDNGQTIFIGGLRRFDDEASVDKIPILGDVPVVNFLFRHNSIKKECTELLIFLTCNVLDDDIPELSPHLQNEYNRIGRIGENLDSQAHMLDTIIHPNKDEWRSPVWRRNKNRDK